MNTLNRTIFVAAALAAFLPACHNSEEPSAVSNGQPSQVVADATPIHLGSGRDPSLPDASAVFAEQDAADKATADATALQQAAIPQKEMSKEEESKAMPLPSQANDHSNPVLEEKKGG